jgi:hypothetical protein
MAGAVSSSRFLEVACDESGSEGERLVGGNTDVFAHAGVDLETEVAAECIRDIRGRIGSPALEYKANHLLREKNRGVLTWLLGPSGPVVGRGRVYLADKSFFVVHRTVEILVGDLDEMVPTELPSSSRTGSMALALYRDGRHAFGRVQWQAFLEVANDLLRVKSARQLGAPVPPEHVESRNGAESPVESLFHLIDLMRCANAPSRCAEVVELLGAAKHRAESFRARLHDDATTLSVADPLIPAIIRAVAYWGRSGRAVAIIHDEQNVLSADVVTVLQDILRRSPVGLHHGAASGPLASLRLVDSRCDPRVQLADFLAGVARKIASDALNGRGDFELTALLRPFVDTASAWAHDVAGAGFDA